MTIKMDKRICSGKELAKMFENSDFSQIYSYVEDKYIDILSRENENGEELGRLIHSESEEIGYFEDIVVSDNEMYRALFQMGVLMGALKIIAQRIYDKKQSSFIFEDVEQKYSGIKHLNDILLLLYSNSTMSHATLSSELGMQDSTMSECMKKVLATQLVSSTRSGKFKNYYLSEDGLRYASEFISRKENSKSNYVLLKQICERFEKGDSEFARRIEEAIKDYALVLHRGDQFVARYDDREFETLEVKAFYNDLSKESKYVSLGKIGVNQYKEQYSKEA